MTNTVLIVSGVVLAAVSLQASLQLDLNLPGFHTTFGAAVDIKPHIVEGDEAAMGQFPYQAALLIDSAAFCGGSLISKTWVLTAGQCVATFHTWDVTLGAHDILDTNETGRVTLRSTNGIVHEDYNATSITADIGVVKLPQDVTLSARINTIGLPPKSFAYKDFVGWPVTVSGWGKVSDGNNSTSAKLRFVELIFIHNEKCQWFYGDIIDKKKYCCSKDGNKGTCSGDSGSAMTVAIEKDVFHLGIVSFGWATGCYSEYPSGYTATPHYLDWISNKTGIAVI